MFQDGFSAGVDGLARDDQDSEEKGWPVQTPAKR